jgi:hypothetical protein
MKNLEKHIQKLLQFYGKMYKIIIYNYYITLKEFII